MVVEAILSTALGLIIELTAPPIIRYLRPIWGGVDGDLKKLRNYLVQIQPLVQDAEERQLMEDNVKSWLMQLRDVSYDAEDILDQANTHVLLIQRKADIYAPLKSKVRDFFSLHHNPLMFQLQLGHKLGSINQRIDDNDNNNNRPWRNRAQTHSYVPESEVIGRDEDKEQIVQMLIRDHFEEKVTVVSIVGMGGLGKTTLALNHLKWDELRRLLVDGREGSRILCLSEERAWALFVRTFTTSVSRQPDFPEIGKKIVNKCKGLPLAIKVMGSVMCSKRDESQWLAVLDDKIWDIPNAATDKIRPELWLSYVDLPSQVKKCFAFCAIFPKDSFIEERMLVQFWMAHGFIPSQTGKDKVVEGQQILDELIGRSLLQFVTDRDARIYPGGDELFSVPGYRVCKMHDLIHDLAQFVTGDECSTLPERNEFMKISKRTRHFILNPWVEYDMGDRAASVLTALPVRTNFIGLSKFKLLRVLKFHYEANADELSTSIEYLLHLRYLNLSDTNIRELPESICMLINLQTLNMNCCYHLTKLLMSIVCMNSLKHLHLRGCSALKTMPPDLSQLRCWKTLTKYTVAENVENKIGELKHWNLDGELRLYDLHKVNNADLAKEVNMSSRQNIKSLSLSRGASVENAEQVLEALKTHSALEMLSLHDYPGTHFSMWIREGKQLQNLVVINLQNCQGCEQLPPLEQLPYLERLTIGRMDGIKCIINNTTGDALSLFPALRTLELNKMANLEGWCGEEDRETAPPLFPCLEDMNIGYCPKLRTRPPQIPTLRHLCIEKSYCETQMALIFKEKGFFKLLKSLESLSLTRCEELAFQTFRNLNSLEYLRITDLEELVSWPDEMFRGLESIRSLNISSCKNLAGASSQGDCGLPFLEDLNVYDCDELIELPKCPTSLKNLSVFNCPSIKSLCSDMGYLTSLSQLKLSTCPKLESLPEGMQGLTSLEELSIEDCPALKSFPEGLQQRLPNLKELKISGCPKLERRCSPGGDYFHLFSSISKRSIKSSPRRTLLASCL
ncbi:putative disease resistance protein RGA1 [Dioscorea cayenensis subsp. rotundata]|uniref:Disease resistance protein RGA1 n=1 Tax=Dioscorea cayennensis subsp. rotundata TaxID=55577 RepID=A0AB40AY67_DIOCR|nr:putative disease resistance protein RGA1 [Dioscorea cayenensis subsp. rotundata]